MKLKGLILAVLVSNITMAQIHIENIDKKVIVNAHTGKWIFENYLPQHIIKITHQPATYTTNENVSDAVILKPVAASGILNDNKILIGEDFTIEIVNNDIIINDKTTVKGIVDSNGFRGFKLGLHENEKITGGGSRALPLNRRGYRFNLYNSPHYSYSEGADNLNFSVPFFISSKGYGLFFDNAAKGYVDIGKSDSTTFEYGTVSGELNVYIILGKDYKEILRHYNKLTGTQPLPPRWALGNLMSRFGYTSEANAEDVLKEMQSAKIPVDAIIFDLFWFGDSIKNTMGNLAWTNKHAWPAPKKMIADFKKQSVNTILITEPFVVNKSRTFNESKKYHAVDEQGNPYLIHDFYFGPAGLIDIFRKDAKGWFWKQHKKQMGIGVEAWWGDLGEPERHPADLYHNLKDKGYKRLFSSDEVHNIYGHNWTKMLYDSFASSYPTKRLFSLNRSGFAGSQRFNIFPWSGDVERSWSGLRAQLPVMLGMSMSGIPYMHSDAGGFAGGEGDYELYVRWLQFAAFTPIFRPHGTALYDKDPHAYSFPSEAALMKEPYKGYAKDVIDLRYALLPYNYTLAYQQATQGKPLARPLFYNYPNDNNSYKADEQYMWGDDILVAPVLHKSDSLKKIYLPEGNWSDAQGKIFEGGKWYDIELLSLTNIPFFFKEGSFICLNNDKGKNTSQTKLDKLNIIHTISSTPSVTQVYFDDGVTKDAIKTKKYELLNFASSINKTERTINIFSTGNFKGKPAKRELFLCVVGYSDKPNSVIINDKQTSIKTVSGIFPIDQEVCWDQQNNRLFIPFTLTKSATITIKE